MTLGGASITLGDSTPGMVTDTLGVRSPRPGGWVNWTVNGVNRVASQGSFFRLNGDTREYGLDAPMFTTRTRQVDGDAKKIFLSFDGPTAPIRIEITYTLATSSSPAYSLVLRNVQVFNNSAASGRTISLNWFDYADFAVAGPRFDDRRIESYQYFGDQGYYPIVVQDGAKNYRVSSQWPIVEKDGHRLLGQQPQGFQVQTWGAAPGSPNLLSDLLDASVSTLTSVPTVLANPGNLVHAVQFSFSDVQSRVDMQTSTVAYVLGDIDGNGVVDINDINAIGARVNTQTRSSESLDIDHDGWITVQDVRKAALLCNNPGCKPNPPAQVATLCDQTAGRVLTVGPGMTYSRPSQANAASLDGDVIKIAAGDYHGDVAAWSRNNLTICGVGGRAVLHADGNNVGGDKGIWQVRGTNTVIDSIEFRGAASDALNAAGIRLDGRNLSILNCGFFDNQDGILAGGENGIVNVERSEFARNGGDPEGKAHNIYINYSDEFNVVSSYFHEAKYGHNLKSRARVTRIENSYFMDGPTGNSTYLLDFQDGGAVYLRGNLLQKGPNTDSKVTAIAYGKQTAPLGHWPVNTLEMTHNTVVTTLSGVGSFLWAPAYTATVRPTIKLNANVFAGIGSTALLAGGFPVADVLQSNNMLLPASGFAGADSISAPNFWPNAAALSKIGLLFVPDASYQQDSPQPFVLRPIAGGTRNIGALQARP